MTRRLRGALVLASATTLLSCGDINAPLRTEIYEWRLTQNFDTLSYHWPREALPVRIWVQDTLNFAVHTQAAIETWKGAFLYREFDGEIVADSAAADVVVRAGFPDGDGLLQKLTLRSRITECEALTELDLNFVFRRLQLPIHVFVSPRFSPALPETQRCFGIVMIHEIGHSLGIFRHSPSDRDIMYFAPVTDTLSERDRQTAEVLYHAPVTVTTTRADQAP